MTNELDPKDLGSRADARKAAEPLARVLCAYECPVCNRPGRERECGEWENYIDQAQYIKRALSDPPPRSGV